MGFPSSAIDYLKCRLELDDILSPHHNNMQLVGTPEGFVLADKSFKPAPGNKVAFQIGELPPLDKLFRTGIIALDGETIDAEGINGIIAQSKLTLEVESIHGPGMPKNHASTHSNLIC